MEDLTQGIESLPILGPVSANIFQYVKTNVPGPGCELDLFTEEFQGCLCDVCSEESCACFKIFGPAYDNGLLLEAAFSSKQPSRPILECGSNCKCKTTTCDLRLVQKGIQAKLRVIQTAEKGYGLQAEHEIVRLSFVCEYAGEVVSENEAKDRLFKCEKSGNMNYLIAIGEESPLSNSQIYVDPRLQGNIGRFINHSCDPNLIMIPVRLNHSVPRLALFARRKICSEEELTFDYSGCTSLDKNNLNKHKSSSLCHEISRDTSFMLPDTHVGMVNHSVNPCASAHANATAGEATVIDSVESEKTTHSVKRRKFDSDSMQNASIPSHDNFSKSRVKNSDLASECTEPSVSKDSSNVQRKLCFCKSKNCKGFLPYESQLFQTLSSSKLEKK